MEKIIVKEKDTLLNFLFNNIEGKSKNNIKSFLKNGNIVVNKKVVFKFDHPLKEGDVISFQFYLDKKAKQKIAILYEDKDLIAIDKPSGLLSVSTTKESQRTAYSLVSQYVKRKNKRNKVFIIHRLDRDTSGVLVLAKNERIKNELQNRWNDIVTKRGYIAVVEGKMKKGKGKIKSYLKETSEYVVYSTNDRTGDLAITNYNVIKNNENFSMLKVFIDTGKKNQIRVHMKDLGHPIIGDKKYRSKINPIKRLGLHAHILEFRHPLTHKLYTFESSVPKIFNNKFQW